MGKSAAITSPAESRTGHGITCILVGMLLFALQDAMMKELLGPFTVWQLIAVRAAITLVTLVPILVVLGGEHRILTPFWRTHVGRGVLFAVGFSLFYAGFPYVNLANLVTIFFAAPLITAALAAVFLGEVVGLHRKLALAVGFFGVVVAMRPGSDSFQWIALLPLACAFSYAVSQVLVRRVGRRDSSLTVGLYTIVTAGVFVVPLGWAVNSLLDLGAAAPHLGFHWHLPTPESAPWLIAIGSVGMVAYIFLGRAYQVADASIVAPFEYSYLPIAALLGYVAWGEVPALATVAGMALIMASGIYIGHRELIDARRAAEPAPTAEAVFVPGYAPPDVADADPAPGGGARPPAAKRKGAARTGPARTGPAGKRRRGRGR